MSCLPISPPLPQWTPYFAAVRERFGRLDLLFNNAGRGAPPMPLEDMPIETWRAVVDANLTGAFLATQGAFRLMKTQQPRGGRIINNGSISAHVPRPQSVAYTASKHAITRHRVILTTLELQPTSKEVLALDILIEPFDPPTRPPRTDEGAT